MGNQLTKSELIALQKYRLTSQLEHSINVADLLDETFLKQFIATLGITIGAPTEKAAASIFIKRYAFIAVMSLYAMTAWNKKINLALDKVVMEATEQGKDWLPSFSLKDWAAEEWKGGDRSEWRNSVFKDIFAHNIFPIIEKLEKTFGISRLILWENIAVYIFWLYETQLKEVGNENVLNDFRYLFFEAEGPLFGRYKGNPLQKYYAEKIGVEDVRMRKTCCFSYQLTAGKRCKTCPCAHMAKDGGCHDGENICTAIRSFA